MKILHLKVKGRTVCENSNGIFDQTKPFFHRFRNKGFVFVRDQKVQRCQRKIFSKNFFRDVDFGEKVFGLRRRFALGKHERNEFPRSKIDNVGLLRVITCFARETQCGDGKPFFIGRVIVERISVLRMRHADHGEMFFALLTVSILSIQRNVKRVRSNAQE